jgi:putative SOS response-associated peptidase YedK
MCMCGRFSFRARAADVADEFDLVEVPPFDPRFNIAPTQPAPVVRAKPDAKPPSRQLVWLRWGLIPAWAKDLAIGGRMINARAETVAEKPAFRAAMRRRRCLVAADGFYEWRKTGKQKQPYFVHMRDDRPFAFAGLWESWEGPDHTAIESCTLLTTEANDLMRLIHDRMPVILPRDAYQLWLDPSQQNPQSLLPLLKPYDSEAMIAYPVGAVVNNASHDEPQCIEPI